jgi:hypothetical protein
LSGDEVVVEAPLAPDLDAFVARLDAAHARPFPMPPQAVLAPRRFPFIVFDWEGGTLIDFDDDSSRARCSGRGEDLGGAVPTDLDARYVIGLGLTDALKHVAPSSPPIVIRISPRATATTSSRATRKSGSTRAYAS